MVRLSDYFFLNIKQPLYFTLSFVIAVICPFTIAAPCIDTELPLTIRAPQITFPFVENTLIPTTSYPLGIDKEALCHK